MRRAIGLFVTCLVGLCACGPNETARVAIEGSQTPKRIVSLDYCADQYVLALSDTEQVAAVSPDAAKDFSFMREAATGVSQVRPRVEDVLALRPDLVVRSYGGGPNAAAMFERAGVPVLQVGWANDLAGVRQVLGDMAAGLGQVEKGAALLADFDQRLATVQPAASGETVLYFTAGGVTAGTGTMVDEIFQAAGRVNFQSDSGWRDIPLERLAGEQPDIVAPAFFGGDTLTQNAWSIARHPIARQQLHQSEVIPLDSAWTSCGGWFLINAIEALAEGGG